jgi:NADH:ubiquinone oxidoreductase subunit 5 (subunit L)/multisubunit Na+/H+ antiporter MnhA subunit
VIGLAARAPLSHSTSIDATSARAPVTALALVLCGLGAVMIGALIAFVWSQRRRKDEPPEPVPEPTEVPWFWKLLTIALPLALGAAIVAAALTGVRTSQSSKGLPTALGVSGPNLTQPTPKPAGSGFVVPAWLPWTSLVILAVAIVAAVWFLVLRQPRVDESDDRAAAEAAVQAAIAALGTERDARAAVIAAYGAMERTLAEHGTARLPSEAPREFLERILLASGATARDAETLTGLFEEARYSAHPIPDRMRELAASALASLRARLHVAEPG